MPGLERSPLMTASSNIQAPDIGLRQNWWIVKGLKVASGAPVEIGDIVAVLENDEALVDMEVFDEGAIAFIVEVGQRVEAGQPIARISN